MYQSQRSAQCHSGRSLKIDGSACSRWLGGGFLRPLRRCCIQSCRRLSWGTRHAWQHPPRCTAACWEQAGQAGCAWGLCSMRATTVCSTDSSLMLRASHSLVDSPGRPAWTGAGSTATTLGKLFKPCRWQRLLIGSLRVPPHPLCTRIHPNHTSLLSRNFMCVWSHPQCASHLDAGAGIGIHPVAIHAAIAFLPPAVLAQLAALGALCARALLVGPPAIHAIVAAEQGGQPPCPLGVPCTSSSTMTAARADSTT